MCVIVHLSSGTVVPLMSQITFPVQGIQKVSIQLRRFATAVLKHSGDSARAYAKHLHHRHRRHRGRCSRRMRLSASACPWVRGCCSRRSAPRYSGWGRSARKHCCVLRRMRRAVRRANEALEYLTVNRTARTAASKKMYSACARDCIRLCPAAQRSQPEAHSSAAWRFTQCYWRHTISALREALPEDSPTHLRSIRQMCRAVRSATQRSPERWSQRGRPPTGTAGSSTPGGTPRGLSGRCLPG